MSQSTPKALPRQNGSDEKKKYATFVIGYPFAILLVAIVINALVLPAPLAHPALPSTLLLVWFVVAAGLLFANHCWIMTATELARVRHGMYATPEEVPPEARAHYAPTPEGLADVARCHNIHRNTTENALYFFPLALAFLYASPGHVVGVFWLMAFPLSRLGYTYSYLNANTNLRSLFMTLTLLAKFGLLVHLLLALR